MRSMEPLVVEAKFIANAIEHSEAHMYLLANDISEKDLQVCNILLSYISRHARYTKT